MNQPQTSHWNVFCEKRRSSRIEENEIWKNLRTKWLKKELKSSRNLYDNLYVDFWSIQWLRTKKQEVKSSTKQKQSNHLLICSRIILFSPRRNKLFIRLNHSFPLVDICRLFCYFKSSSSPFQFQVIAIVLVQGHFHFCWDRFMIGDGYVHCGRKSSSVEWLACHCVLVDCQVECCTSFDSQVFVLWCVVDRVLSDKLQASVIFVWLEHSYCALGERNAQFAFFGVL